MKHISKIALAFFPLALIAEQQEPAALRYADIAAQHISSFPVPQAKPPKPESEKTWWEKATRMDAPTFTAQKFDTYTSLSVSYQSFMMEKLSQLFEQSIVRPTLYKDLEIISGTHTKQNSLLQLVNRTNFIEGQIYLGALLTHPTTDIQVLQDRQQIIQTLVTNDSLRASLNSLLTQVQTHHDALLTFWGNEQPANKLYVDQRYFTKPMLTRLNTSITFQHFSFFQDLMAWPLIISSPALFYMYGNGVYMQKNYPTLAKINPIMTGYMAVFAGVASSQGLPAYIKLLNYLHEKSIGVAQLIKALDQVEKAINEHEKLEKLTHRKVFSDYAHVKRYLHPKLAKLIGLLRTNTFKDKPTFFALKGRVCAAHALIEELRPEITTLIVALAELDAYLSCANLYVEHAHEDNKYSFATYADPETGYYVQAGQPYVCLIHMWNPFVGGQTSIANSITLGGDLPRNVILTGPNAGGKSTFSKGVAINVLLAQTIGIVPAQGLTLTPFSKINTYMNIADDTAGGNSLFKSEVLRAQELLDTITTLPKHQFSFSVMDEMFSGTSPKEGEAAGYAVAKSIGNNPHSLAIIATHFPLLKELEQETSYFKNYQVRVVRHEDGTFSYPFKLEEGAADQNVAIDILHQQGFSSGILQDAHAILNRITK